MINETSPDVHTYRLKTWVLLVNTATLVFFLLLFGGVAASMLATMEMYRAEVESDLIQYSFLAIAIPMFILMAIVVIQLVIALLQCFFSYIKVTPDGIEHKVWLARHIRTGWPEVDRLGKFLFYDAVFLKSYEVIGFSPSYRWPWKLINFAQNAITVSTYQGWPQGRLADDLKRHAPGLFEQPSLVVEAQSPEAVSQEDRLLAALSHASIIFAGISIFVPLVIYATHKEKSRFLAFQTLQAFYYQLVGILLGFILPFCIIGVVLVAAFIPLFTRSGVSYESFLSIMMITSMAMIGLLALVSIAYIVYGVVGGVQTYQGKDFRYAVIGKRVEKGLPTG